MQYLTNAFDPRHPLAKAALIIGLNEAREQAWVRHLAWLKDKFIGPPKATEHCSRAELEAMSMVGVYTSEPGEEWGLGFWSFDTYMA